MHFCSGYPNLLPYLLHLGAQIASSTPDALMYLPSCRNVEKENAIAVIKVILDKSDGKGHFVTSHSQVTHLTFCKSGSSVVIGWTLFFHERGSWLQHSSLPFLKHKPYTNLHFSVIFLQPSQLDNHAIEGTTLNFLLILIFIQINKECRKCETDEGYGEQRSLGKKLKLDQNMNHIPSELKAEHIGEMLALLPSSVFGTRGIYGFLVQGTKVNIEKVLLSLLKYASCKTVAK